MNRQIIGFLINMAIYFWYSRQKPAMQYLYYLYNYPSHYIRNETSKNGGIEKKIFHSCWMKIMGVPPTPCHFIISKADFGYTNHGSVSNIVVGGRLKRRPQRMNLHTSTIKISQRVKMGYLKELLPDWLLKYLFLTALYYIHFSECFWVVAETIFISALVNADCVGDSLSHRSSICFLSVPQP